MPLTELTAPLAGASSRDKYHAPNVSDLRQANCRAAGVDLGDNLIHLNH